MSADPAPLSKTAKYKKITKPLLERKRRARINRCLDELKDLMVGALEVSANLLQQKVVITPSVLLNKCKNYSLAHLISSHTIDLIDQEKI